LAVFLRAVERPGIAKRQLAARQENGRTVAGLELTGRGEVRTVWWDTETFLPVRMSVAETSAEGPLEMHLAFAYNEPVPAEVAAWKPPQAKNVRYAGSEKSAVAWREHVAMLGRELEDQPLEGRVALVPRRDGRIFSLAWTLPTPDGRYLVTPVASYREPSISLFDWIRLQISDRDASSRLENWRVPAEFRDLAYCHDVVHEPAVPWHEWVQVVLAHHDLEFVDVVEPRTVWVARCEDPAKRPTGPVDPPVPYIVEGGVEKKGLVRCGVGMRLIPVTLEMLFEDFNRMQAQDHSGTSIIIEDQTGWPQPPAYNEALHGGFRDYWRNVVEPKYLVATDSPYFRGPESLEMARTWYRDKLGITFTEESRPMTVHVVRRKAK
jgi:hypothetical protein